MIVKAWPSGGTGYGVKIKMEDRVRFFDRKWKSVTLQFEDSPLVAEAKCGELIKKEIGDWLRDRKMCPWEPKHPPTLWLQPLGSSRFLLRTLKPTDL